MTTKRKAMSKTKAQANRRKTAKDTATFKAKTEGKPRDVLLGQLMEQYLMTLNEENAADDAGSISFADILGALGMNDRNTKWRNVWKDLHASKLTEQLEQGASIFTSGFRLTPAGREEASTEELKEIMAKSSTITAKNKPKTNEELHTFIKSKLMNQRGEQILDLLVDDHEKEGEGMSRKELSKALGISDTGAYFSYALQQLKDLGYAENVRSGQKGKGTKVCLTGKAFVAADGKRDDKCGSATKEKIIVEETK